jgi:antitoxin (DNA-binding transcriptional repressor) of toxin-antitoxin stability system
MYSIALKEAQSQLEALTAKVVTGEEVIITDDKGMIFQLIQVKPKKFKPKFGSAKGLISMTDDFDEPLDDFKDYMP